MTLLCVACWQHQGRELQQQQRAALMAGCCLEEAAVSCSHHSPAVSNVDAAAPHAWLQQRKPYKLRRASSCSHCFVRRGTVTMRHALPAAASSAQFQLYSIYKQLACVTQVNFLQDAGTLVLRCCASCRRVAGRCLMTFLYVACWQQQRRALQQQGRAALMAGCCLEVAGVSSSTATQPLAVKLPQSTKRSQQQHTPYKERRANSCSYLITGRSASIMQHTLPAAVYSKNANCVQHCKLLLVII
jgi:hypothetical protein